MLDVNVLLALAWPTHLHHEAALVWFASHRANGWATCIHTQLAFLRLSAQPAVVLDTVSIAEARSLLAANLDSPDHHFWPLDHGMLDLLPEIQQRVVAPSQLADGLLLDLAIRRKGRFATFDRRIANLLPPDSPHRARLVILSSA